MKKEIISLADHLDKIGMFKEADLITETLYKYANSFEDLDEDSFEEEDDSDMGFSYDEENPYDKDYDKTIVVLEDGEMFSENADVMLVTDDQLKNLNDGKILPSDLKKQKDFKGSYSIDELFNYFMGE